MLNNFFSFCKSLHPEIIGSIITSVGTIASAILIFLLYKRQKKIDLKFENNKKILEERHSVYKTLSSQINQINKVNIPIGNHLENITKIMGLNITDVIPDKAVYNEYGFETCYTIIMHQSSIFAFSLNEQSFANALSIIQKTYVDSTLYLSTQVHSHLISLLSLLMLINFECHYFIGIVGKPIPPKHIANFKKEVFVLFTFCHKDELLEQMGKLEKQILKELNGTKTNIRSDIKYFDKAKTIEEIQKGVALSFSRKNPSLEKAQEVLYEKHLKDEQKRLKIREEIKNLYDKFENMKNEFYEDLSKDYADNISITD